MRRSRLLLAGVAATLAMTTLVAVGGAGAAAPVKKVCKGDLSPSEVTAGAQNQVFQLTLTNLAPPDSQTLGSANLTAPSGFTLEQVVVPPPPPGSATINVNTLELRDLNLPPDGGSVTVSFTADVPNDPGPHEWSLACKQSNQFLGTGNDFQVDPDSTLTTKVEEEEPPPPEFGAGGENSTSKVCQDAQNTDCTLESSADTDDEVHTRGRVTFLAAFTGEGSLETFRFTFNLETGNFCAFALECTGFVLNMGNFPPGYDPGGIEAELEIDQTLLGPLGVVTVWINKDGTITPALPCVDSLVTPCVADQGTQEDGDAFAVVRFGSGDPIFGLIST